MKRIFLFAAALACAACAKDISNNIELENSEEVVLEAYSAESDATKTALVENGDIIWNPGDQISLFFASGNNGGNKFTSMLTESNAISNFTGNIGVITGGGEITLEQTYFWGVYPYNELNSCDGTSITAVLPDEQIAVAGSFANGAFPTMGRSSNLLMGFYNIAGGIKFTVANDNIKKVTFRNVSGEPISGQFSAAFDENTQVPVVKSISEEGSSEITVTAPNGGCFEPGVSYYASILPVTFSNGMEVIYRTENTMATYTVSSSFTIKRKTFSKVTAKDSGLAFTEISSTNSPLTFTSTGENSISLVKNGTPDEITLEYKLNDGSWTNYTVGDAISLADGEKVSFRAEYDGNNTFSSSSSNYFQFSNSGAGTIAASGNIMSLVDATCQSVSIPSVYCFAYLFKGLSSMTSAPELPATTLATGCYSSMFSGCTGLESAPVLPATTLADDCYYGMFRGCTGLTQAPELPATTLANSCYQFMFYGCIRITQTPQLPATTLASYCYSRMFSDCLSLRQVSELPATTLADYCYQFMFYGCSSLTVAPELPATVMKKYCYDEMFSMTALTSAPELPATTLAEDCYYYMFAGTPITVAPALPATKMANQCYGGMFFCCTSLTTPPALPATVLDRYCYEYMFYGCNNLTYAPELPATELATYCYRYMFASCRSLTTAPILPAETLNESSYEAMFNDCSNLKYIKMLATNIAAGGCLNVWTYGVASSGTFVKSSKATWNVRGDSGIPTGWTVITE